VHLVGFIKRLNMMHGHMNIKFVQDSSRITLADSLFTCPPHLCHWHMTITNSTSVYHTGLASDNIKPPDFAIIFIWTQ